MARRPRILWLPEEDDVIRELGSLKQPASYISTVLGNRSRNAVISRSHKINVKLDGASFAAFPRSRKTREPKEPKPKKIVAKPDEVVDRSWVVGRVLPPLAESTVIALPKNPRRLTELPVGGCKYPFQRGEDGEWLLCSDQRWDDKSPYCKPHHVDCYQPKTYYKKKSKYG